MEIAQFAIMRLCAHQFRFYDFQPQILLPGLCVFQHDISVRKYRDALVLDRMEPLRPLVDGVVLGIVLKETLNRPGIAGGHLV